MSQDKIVAVLDIGPDAVLLLIARYSSDGKIETVNEYMAITKLCEKLSRTGVLLEEAINRTVTAAKEMQAIAFKEGAQNLIVTASSIVRNSDNKSKFLVKCFQGLKIYPQVLSGKEEAKFSFIGATMDLEQNQPVILINIEEGSTEIAIGTGESLVSACSLDIGCYKINEALELNSKGFLSNPVIAAQNFIKREFHKVEPEISGWLAKQKSPFVLVSGAISTTYAAIIKKQFIYDYKQINFTKGTRKSTYQTFKYLNKMKIEDRVNVPGMEIGRAEMLPAGLLVLYTILDSLHIDDFTITVKGLRTGLIKYFVER
jgi:exopolyphosphatase/guanosine-5'-triphosphate,3'-diphosphate pyrophosphatase